MDDLQGLNVNNTDPKFDEWFETERGNTSLDDYNVYDECGEDYPYEE